MNEELKILISAEVTKLRQGVEQAKQAIKGFGEQVEKAKKDVDANFQKIGQSIKTAATAIGVSIAAVGAALLANVSATEEYRNQQAQLLTSFEAAGQSAEAAKETYNGLYRVLGDTGQAQEAAQHLAKLGVEQQHLQEYTHSLQGVYSTFGASLPLEGLTEGINHTVKLGEVQGSLADALEWSGISTDAFNEKLAACNSESEREKLIRETLTSLYSNAADVYEKNNKKVLEQRDAQAKLQEQTAKLGDALAPVVTAFSNFAGEALAMVTPYIQSLAEKLMPLLQSALDAIIPAIQDAAKWVKEHETLLQAVGVAIGVVVTAIGLYNAAAAVKAAMAAAEVTSVMALVAAYAAQAVAMAAALLPYIAIAAAIAAVIAVIVVCVKHWDEIKEAAKKAWEGIKKAWEKAGEWFGKVWDGIKGAFKNVGSWFSDTFTRARQGVEKAWSSTKTFFATSWDNIKTAFSKTKEWFSDTFKKAWEGVKAAFANPKEFFSGVLDKIKGAISSIDSWMGDKFGSAWENVKAKFSGVSTFFTNVWNTIKNIFSKVGTAIADGIKGAVTSAVNRVLSTATKIINGFISAINFAIDIINAIPGVNIKRLEKLSVPQMAKGGVVDSATLAVIGEQGKEAVIPLENNLQWLDKLATMLNDRMGGNQPIVMNVDGKRFAEISVESINNLTRQRGSIPLVIA